MKALDKARFKRYIYLHYTDWAEFCAYLTVLTMKPLVESKKVVFLIEDEIEQYPIDFKERFKIDYSKYPVKPVGIREINKLIWHTQLSSHNGGDFFNEIFDSHPNLIAPPSMMMSKFEKAMNKLDQMARDASSYEALFANLSDNLQKPGLVSEFYSLRDRTMKDTMSFYFLADGSYTSQLDPNSRIAPAFFFQPHFPNMIYALHIDERNNKTILDAEEEEKLHESPVFKNFKYIKTFTPLRRFTTSHAATVKYMKNVPADKTNEEGTEKNEKAYVLPDIISERILNRSYMIDRSDRLYRDSVLVRFEDGKLNPRATFSRLAGFLDIPYTESMTYCSEKGMRDTESMPGNVRGFDPETVYRTYDDYANDNERKYIEFFLRDAYEYYGYGFQWYDGAPVSEEQVDAWIDGFTTLDRHIREAWERVGGLLEVVGENELSVQLGPAIAKQHIEDYNANRKEIAHILLRGLRFVNKRGQPLEFTPMLQPDPDLLDQPLYH